MSWRPRTINVSYAAHIIENSKGLLTYSRNQEMAMDRSFNSQLPFL